MVLRQKRLFRSLEYVQDGDADCQDLDTQVYGSAVESTCQFMFSLGSRGLCSAQTTADAAGHLESGSILRGSREGLSGIGGLCDKPCNECGNCRLWTNQKVVGILCRLLYIETFRIIYSGFYDLKFKATTVQFSTTEIRTGELPEIF